MDHQVPGSVVAGIEPKPQAPRGSDFAGFWTELNPLGNKPVELPQFPRNESPPAKHLTSLGVVGSGDRETSVDAPHPPEKTPWIARPVDEIQVKATAVNLPDVALNHEFQERLPGQENPARVHSVESFPRQRSLKNATADAAIRRVDEASILSSRRSANQSSRSLCQGCRLLSNPPHVLPLPPGTDGVIHIAKDEISFPGYTNLLAQLRIGNSRTDDSFRRLSKESAVGGSCRETRSSAALEVNVSRPEPHSLPTSPCSSSIEFLRAWRSCKESRASKLLRKLKLSGIRSRGGANLDTKAGRRNGISREFGKLSKQKGSKSVNKAIASQHQKLRQNSEARIPELRNHGVQDFGNQTNHIPTIHSECMNLDSKNCFATPDSSTQPSVRRPQGSGAALQGHSNKTRGSRWAFKWRWGSKPTTKMTGKRIASSRAVNPNRRSPAVSGESFSMSTTANIMSEVRSPRSTKSDRFLASGKSSEKRDSGSGSRQRRGSSWGCSSRASTAVLTPGTLNIPMRSRLHDDQGATESSQARSNLAGSRVSRIIHPGVSQSSRIEETNRNFQESYRGTGGHSFRSVGGYNSMSNGGHSFRRIGGHSFRSIGGESFRSAGGHSFRSIGGESFRSAGGHSFRSMGSSGGGQSFRKDPVFEDCHGSFRSTGSPGSYSSFRSVGSPSVGGSHRFPSVEEMEWDSRLPPPLQGDQNLSIDVASLCNSSLTFVFKCREVQHLNRFLKTQRKCILRGSEKGNNDRFHVILSGADIGIYGLSFQDPEMLLFKFAQSESPMVDDILEDSRVSVGDWTLAGVSSMVTAMCYAWFLENTVPKVTDETWHAIPVMDIRRHQMHKHKDAAWLFDACGIDAAALLFADEIEMASLKETGRIKTSAIGQDVLVTRNEVGSVCTLLGEKLLAEAQCLLEARYMKTLLLAGILLETENLDFASNRDTEMATMLLVGSGSLGRNGFFNQLKEVVDDDRVSKFITRNYGDGEPPSGAKGLSAAPSKIQEEEADQEQFDKDSLFTPSQDQTSTSEAGTTSSLEEDSPRLKQRSSFKYTKLHPHSAPARSHQLPSPSSAGCNDDEITLALRRKAATRSASSGLPLGTRSPSSKRIQKRLFLYQA